MSDQWDATRARLAKLTPIERAQVRRNGMRLLAGIKLHNARYHPDLPADQNGVIVNSYPLVCVVCGGAVYAAEE